jgi:D-alanyl-D-alanine carboxypeptidase
MHTILLATVVALWSLTPAQTARIDAAVNAALAQQHIVGAEVGVGRDGSVLYKKGYGYRNLAKKLPVTANTLFPIGSITKQFTAACIMLLVQDGKVDLDAKVARYLPDAPHGDEVTVRQLLDQTSGMPEYLAAKGVFDPIAAGNPPHYEPAQLVALVNGVKLNFKPGTKWAYSNTNYVLLGMIVAKVSGHSYPAFLAENVLDPLGLTDTRYLATSVPSDLTDVTRGYNYAKGMYAMYPSYDFSWGGAAGAIGSTVTDLIAWDGSFFSGSLISPANEKIATTPPAVGTGFDKAKGVPSYMRSICLGYAFGWCTGTANGRKIVWHNGGVIGGRTVNAVFPKSGLEVVVLTNMTDASPEPIALKIEDIIEGK